MPPSFSLSAVSRQWGQLLALNNINLSIRPGEVIALIGPSGSGKSTLLHLLAGVLRPTAGTLKVDDQCMEGFTPRQLKNHRAHCRIIEQNHLLVPQSSVHQNVLAGDLAHWRFTKVLASLLWPIEKQRVQALLSSLGIADQQWKLASELSGGQMQRVAVARALISNPSVLLADEPTASLDPVTARAVTETLLAQARQRGVTLVFCTHWLQSVLEQCDRVVGLRQGRIVLDSVPGDVSQNALDDLYEGSNERF